MCQFHRSGDVDGDGDGGDDERKRKRQKTALSCYCCLFLQMSIFVVHTIVARLDCSQLNC